MTDFIVKTAEDIREDYLRTYAAGLMALGVANPAVGPGSDVYVFAQALGNQLEVAMANGQIQADALLPDTAVGDDLDRWLNLFGIPRRAAAGATGSVTFDATATSYVTVNTQLIDSLGQRYRVTVGGSYADGATIPVAAIDTGASTNHESGDVLQWVTPPPFAANSALVASSDLSGGVDEEDDAAARARLRDFLTSPPASGNWAHVAQWAQESSTLVERAFVYPCANGPGNFAVCVVGYATDVSKSRQVDGVTVINVITQYIAGKAPEPIDLIVTSAVDASVDVAFYLSLPSSPKASPPGPGGGWTDGTTWPKATGAVTSVTSSVTFTVSASAPPTVGVTQVCWLSPLTWTTYTATVVASSSPSSGLYTITLDKPFPNIYAGALISPNAVNASVYFNAIVAQFAKMGPGELLASTSPRFGRAFRHPTPYQSAPYTLDASLLRALTSASPEVLDADFAYRSTTSAPAVPLSVTGAPQVFVPGNIAIYEKTS